jgi:hypothetical protein
VPRNNSASRRAQRQTVAQFNELRRQDNAVTELFASVTAIMNEAADAAGFHVAELARQNAHACGNEANCALHRKACAALNQNMPPHLIVGQRTD